MGLFCIRSTLEILRDKDRQNGHTHPFSCKNRSPAMDGLILIDRNGYENDKLF